MKRNMDLVRQILLALKAHEDPAGMANVEIEGRQPAEVNSHLTIMAEAGLIYGQEQTYEAIDDTVWMYVRLTWQGHEFVNAARDDKRWEEVKRQLAAVGGGTLPITTKLLSRSVRRDVGLADA